MDLINCNYYIQNGIVIEADFSEDLITSKGVTLYEVIRVMSGVPLFIEEHLRRLTNSAKLTKIDLKYSNEEIKSQIKVLIEKNKRYEGNIKIILNHNEEDNIYAYFIKHKYPLDEMYSHGVETILYHGERENPNAKVINSIFRKKVDEKITAAEAFEAILVDNNGNVTEGSKSNIFMIKGRDVITAPIKDVLPGVTRDRIIELLRKLHFNIVEKNVNYKEIFNMDAIFITGTSPKVLPINKVEEIKINSINNPILIKIIIEYNILIEKYIKSNKM
ncbi:MAG: aminotransferase class IV [Clostridiaceae bacterium]|nr:aminotransferase class IV [Clostridiaceae bacterium]